MLQSSAADFINAVGLAEVDCHIAIFYGWFDWIAQIALRHDLDFPIALRQIEHSSSHAPSRANQQHAHGRILHSCGAYTL
jgi:hypothetical protein